MRLEFGLVRISWKAAAMPQPAQIKAARALLGWRQEDLSKASGVGTANAIQRIEKSDRPMTGYVSTAVRI